MTVLDAPTATTAITGGDGSEEHVSEETVVFGGRVSGLKQSDACWYSDFVDEYEKEALNLDMQAESESRAKAIIPGMRCREVWLHNGKLAGESGALSEGGKSQFEGLCKSSAEHLEGSGRKKKECRREKFDVSMAMRGLTSVRRRVFPSKFVFPH